eukprot:1765063-Rhodomonas_salina.1
MKRSDVWTSAMTDRVQLPLDRVWYLDVSDDHKVVAPPAAHALPALHARLRHLHIPSSTRSKSQVRRWPRTTEHCKAS